MVDKQRQTAISDADIPSDSKINKQKQEKLEKYQGLREELEDGWISSDNDDNIGQY